MVVCSDCIVGARVLDGYSRGSDSDAAAWWFVMPFWDREKPESKLTRPHRRLHSILVQMGFDVMDEVEIPRSEGRTYRLDCYISELHMGFECDGRRAHAGIRKQIRDRDRDCWIFENAGIPVMRIPADALRREDLTEQIMDFIKKFSSDIDERRSRALIMVRQPTA
jgi:hypothetical protein